MANHFLWAVLVMVSLGGCHQDVPVWTINSIQKQCAEHGGIEKIDTLFWIDARCIDGRRVIPERGR